MPRENKSKMVQVSGEQEEMTVVILRFKGGGETLQRGFDTVSQALAALGPPSGNQRRIAPLGHLPATHARTVELPGTDGGGATPEVPPDGAEPEAVGIEIPEESGQRGGTGGRKYSKPKFDSTLKLDAGDVTFKDYCAQRQPDSDNDKYLVAAAWLTKHGGHPTFTASQVFTCFRAMGWNEQADFMQPVRLMMKNKSYFEKAGRYDWKLTQVGMDASEAIRPKAP
ncbi:MAG: hypothetical protein WCD04_06660 [Terriglobia bacterium]